MGRREKGEGEQFRTCGERGEEEEEVSIPRGAKRKLDSIPFQNVVAAPPPPPLFFALRFSRGENEGKGES